jgi:predicted enzyme related to lactoylglutathione lyase
MRIGEVGLLTNDVIKLTLETENGSNDSVHKTILAEETMLTIYNDGSVKNNKNQNICLAFTVNDIDAEYEKLVKLGAEIIEESKLRPCGTKNMSFHDPDKNVIYFRSFNK